MITAGKETTFKLICMLGLVGILTGTLTGQTFQRMRIKTVIGKAELQSGSGKWRPVRVNMPLRAGWDIRTYVESSVEIEFSTGTVIRIGEKSAFNLSQAFQNGEETKSHVKVYTGKVWGNVQKLVGKNSSFEFETPTAVASIRGTRLGVSVDKNGTAVDVYEGAVAVRKKGGTKTVLVKTKNRAVVEKEKSAISVMSFKEALEEEKNTDVSDPFITEKSDTHAPEESTFTDEPGADTVQVDSTKSEPSVEETDTQSEPADSADEQPLQEDEQSSDSIEETQPLSQSRLLLVIREPSDGQVIKKPIIKISGTSTPGATVQIDNARIPVGAAGNFLHEIHIPDEQGDIRFDVVAQLNGAEEVQSRTITYEPRRQPLMLSVQSPADGQLWDKNAIMVVGKTSPKAAVVVNGRPALVSSAGAFNANLRIAEKDLGKDYPIEIQASNEFDELEETITLTPDIKSRLLNTSIPSVSVTGIAQRATRNGQISLQVTDRTPGDQIRVVADNDGSLEEHILEPNGFENMLLEEGKNSITVVAYDMAQNRSNTVRADIYYLPGPLEIVIQQPFENPLVIDDLPPMPHNVGAMKKEIEVDINDGIGTVPETIQYVKVKGRDGEHLLKNVNRYTYRGTVTLLRGRNMYTVITEDMAGNRATGQIEIIVAR